MSKAKTKQQGYVEVKSIDKWLHFSMNCWVILQEERGKEITSVLKGFEDLNNIEQVAVLSDLIYAAAKAYSLEESVNDDFTIYDIRNSINNVTSNETNNIIEAISASLKPPTTGKKKAKK